MENKIKELRLKLEQTKNDIYVLNRLLEDKLKEEHEIKSKLNSIWNILLTK